MRRMERSGKKLVSLTVTLAMAASLVAGAGLTGYANGAESVSGADTDTVGAADTDSVSVNEADAADTGVNTAADADADTGYVMLPASEEELQGAVMVAAEGETSYFDSVADAFDYANTQASSAVTLLADCEADAVLYVEEDAAITLNLAGCVLSQADDVEKSVIIVYGDLTLEDSSEDGTGTLTGGRASHDSGGGILVKSTGTLVMNGGNITGNEAYCYGGGVMTYGNFTMNGGTISGNTAGTAGGGVSLNDYYGASFTMNGGVISDNTAGTAASGFGGGVHANGAFIMNDGEISGNGAYVGGGVYIYGGWDGSEQEPFNMNGGVITGNSATYQGAGVAVQNNTFYFNSGEISGNAATGTTTAGGGSRGGGISLSGCAANPGLIVMGEDTVVSGNTAVTGGGGIFLSIYSTLEMEGGEVSGNAVTNDRSRGTAYGGGIYVGYYSGDDSTLDPSSTLKLNGGSITGNSAESVYGTYEAYGGGVYGYDVSTEISGSIVITGNTAGGEVSNYFLPDGQTITLDDGLAEGADIGVTTESVVTPAGGARQLTAAETETSYYKTAVNYISSDAGYSRCTSEDGYVMFYVPPSTYTLTSSLAHLSSSNDADSIDDMQDYATVLTADEGYEIPVSISITVGGETLAASAYAYDALTGVLTIPASEINGDIVITAVAVEITDVPDTDEDGYYILDSTADVSWFADRVCRGMSDINGRLAADVVMTSDFAGIGTETFPFAGTFDGAGYTVTVGISSDGAVGMFSYADGAGIRNLTVTGSVTSASYAGAGGIVGVVGENGLTMENCENTASVSGEGYVGGLVGNASGCEVVITDCVNSGDITCMYMDEVSTYVSVTGKTLPITGQGFYTGGAVGYVAAGTVTGVSNYGTVIGNSHVGGVIGKAALEYATGSLTISDCMNYGAVNGVDSPVGGIVGKACGVSSSSVNTTVLLTIIRCGNEGNITADLSTARSNAWVGGIAGVVMDDTSMLRSLYNAGSVTMTGKSDAYCYAGGIFGVTECSLTDVYNVGAVTTQYKRQYAGGIFGGENNVATEVIVGNAYNAGVVMMGEAAGGSMAGYVASSCLTFFVNSYFLDTLKGNLSYFGTGLYVLSISTEEFTLTDSGYVRSKTGYESAVVISDEEIKAMKVSSDTLAAMASTLGDGFKTNTDSSLHLGYPALSWEYVPAEMTDDPEVDDTEEIITYLMGDVNGDGAVDTKDVTVLSRYAAGVIEDSEINLNAADVNSDGSVDTRDVTILSRHCAGVNQDYAIGSVINISAAD